MFPEQIQGGSLLPPDGFDEKLRRLRVRIDSLPESHRPRLVELAEAIAQQHRQLEHRKSHCHDADRAAHLAD